MKKVIVSFLILVSIASHAVEFKVICANTDTALNTEIAKLNPIDVSEPKIAIAMAAGSVANGDRHSVEKTAVQTNRAICVTVKY